MERERALTEPGKRETPDDGPAKSAASAKRETGGGCAAFRTPYGCFWTAVVGLAFEGCAGEFRRFTVPPTVAVGQIDAFVSQIACTMLAAIVLAVAFRHTRSFTFGRRAWGVGASIAFALGLALYFQERIFVTSAVFLGDFGYYLAVAGGYLYLLVWFDRLLAFGAKGMLLTIGASLVLRGGLQALLLLLQQTPSVCLLVVLPLISLPFFLRVHADAQERGMDAPDPQNASYLVGDTTVRNGRVALGALIVIMMFIAIISNTGLSRTAISAIEPNGSLAAQVFCVIANVATGIALFAFAQLRFRKMLLLTFFLATIAMACMALFAASSESQAFMAIGSLMLNCARKCLDFAVVFPAFLFAVDGIPQFRWHVASRFATGVGGSLGSWGLSSTGMPLETAQLVTGGCLLGLFVALIVLFSCFDSSTNALAVTDSPPAPAEPLHRPFKEALDRIAEDAKLTPAEINVLELVARGANAESVRQELVISVNTAKTHIRNIYAKLGVHSQQELIAMVNKAKEDIVSTYRD